MTQLVDRCNWSENNPEHTSSISLRCSNCSAFFTASRIIGTMLGSDNVTVDDASLCRQTNAEQKLTARWPLMVTHRQLMQCQCKTLKSFTYAVNFKVGIIKQLLKTSMQSGAPWGWTLHIQAIKQPYAFTFANLNSYYRVPLSNELLQIYRPRLYKRLCWSLMLSESNPGC